jgi:hypothetical protein
MEEKKATSSPQQDVDHRRGKERESREIEIRRPRLLFGALVSEETTSSSVNEGNERGNS